MNKRKMLAAIPAFVDKHWPKIDPDGLVPTPGRGEAAVAIAAFITEVVPDDDMPEQFDQLDMELLAEAEKYRGHIEDMSDDARVFLLGALAGALRRRLAHGDNEPSLGTLIYNRWAP